MPPDVRDLESELAPDGLEARRDGLSRTYLYRILHRRVASAFERRYAVHVPRDFDQAVLDACAKALHGTHDFTAFTPSDTRHGRFERNVLRTEWMRESEHVTAFWIEADTFMRHMV